MDLSKFSFKEAEKIYERSAYDAGKATLQLEMAKYNQHRLAVGFTEKANELMRGHSEQEVLRQDGTTEQCEFLQFIYRSEEVENALVNGKKSQIGLMIDSLFND